MPDRLDSLIDQCQAVAQITSTASMTHNLAQCRIAVQKAVAGKAKILFLPEASDYIGGSSEESISLCQPVSQSLFVKGLQEDARKHALPISVGVHEPSNDKDNNRIKNTLLWIDARGEIQHRYQKLHMFDVNVPGGPIIQESKTTEPGAEIVPPFESPLGRIGAMICFDLRFPELSLALRRQNAEILLYPSAFSRPTGAAHWLPLIRARAIECQSYVIAAAQVGSHNEKRSSYGHSIVVDPWGEIVGQLDGVQRDEPEVLFATIDLDKVETIRRNMPLVSRT